VEHKSKSVIKSLLPYFGPYKYWFIIGSISLLLSTVLSLWLPLIVQDIINNMLSMRTIQIIKTLAVVLASLILETISKYVFSVSGHRMVRDIRRRTWDNVLKFKVEEFDNTHSGELSSRIISDSSIITSFVSRELPGMIIGVITILCSIVIMFFLDHVLTLVFICLTPLIIFTIKPISNRVLYLTEKIQELLADMNGFFTEILSQNRLIKAYNAEQFEANRGFTKIEGMCKFGIYAAKIQAVLDPIMGAIITILVISVIGIGTYRTSRGYITPGSLVAFILYFFQIIEPVQSIGSFIMEKEAVKGTTKELLRISSIVGEELSLGENNLICDNIIFDNVSFSYNNSDVILEDFSCVIEKGKKTAIVGESGSGKTTVISLIERFYYPQKGKILIGEKNINEISLTEWRKLFGYVSQDNAIITGTLKDNILYGITREVSEEELMSVIKAVNLEEFVSSIPEKFEYYIGEQGRLLSGGQKQRIAIARALLRNPQYILLDEATANLDSESERIVQDALDNLLNGRTAIVIAHRLSSVINADKIIVLQKGKVIGEGVHEDLYRNCDYYRMIVDQQFTKYAGKEN